MTEKERLLALLEEAKQDQKEADNYGLRYGYNEESIKRIGDAAREIVLIYNALEKEKEREILK